MRDVDAPVIPVTPDLRIDPPGSGTEADTLVAFLAYQRATVVRKMGGLTAVQLSSRSVPPSTLSPLGIVRHLTEVERYWLTEVLLGDDLDDLYCSRDDRDGDFHNGTPESAPLDVAAWIEEVRRAGSRPPLVRASPGSAGVAAVDPAASRRGVRPPPRSPRPAARGDRRRHRRVKDRRRASRSPGAPAVPSG